MNEKDKNIVNDNINTYDDEVINVFSSDIYYNTFND